MNRVLCIIVAFLYGLNHSVISSDETNTCLNIQVPPQSNGNYPLGFCTHYSTTSCCLPVQDAEMEEHYLNLIEAGPTCAKIVTLGSRKSLKLVFCLGCSPLQPQYVGLPAMMKNEPQSLFRENENVLRICDTLAQDIHPSSFSQCGMTLVAERGNPCAGDDTIVPHLFWPDCQEGEYTCRDQVSNDWYCSPKVCESENTPTGLNPAFPCHDMTCSGTFKFLNDNRGAKPPYFEDYTVQIVNQEKCVKNCDCFSGSILGSSSSPRQIPSNVSIWSWVTILMVYGHIDTS